MVVSTPELQTASKECPACPENLDGSRQCHPAGEYAVRLVVVGQEEDSLVEGRVVCPKGHEQTVAPERVSEFPDLAGQIEDLHYLKASQEAARRELLKRSHKLASAAHITPHPRHLQPDNIS